MTDDIKFDNEDELPKASDDEMTKGDLDAVSGGINPQPLPPHHPPSDDVHHVSGKPQHLV